MTALDRVRERFKTAMSGTSKASKSPSAGFAGTRDRHFKSCEPPSAGSAGSPLPTDSEAAARHNEVLKRLEASPNIARAFGATPQEDGSYLVTVAVRGVATGELSVPAGRLSKLEDLTALMQCMESG